MQMQNNGMPESEMYVAPQICPMAVVVVCKKMNYGIIWEFSQMAPRECKDLIQAPCAVVHCGPAAIGRVNLSTVNGQLHILQAHQRHL